MSITPLKNDAEKFKANASIVVKKWLHLMLKRHYQEASNICIGFIENYGFEFIKRSFEADENEYNQMLVLLIYIKALHEYVQLCQITQNTNWHEDNSTVEQVWIKLCDCKQRLELSSQYCQGEAIERVIYDLDGLENFFQDEFGFGNYFSPGIVSDKSLCNIICYEDCRACSHIAGRLYDGRICFYKPINPQINHIALVKIPKDPRCRIWSWNIKDNEQGEGIIITNTCILTSFSVDDFLHKIEY